MMGPGQAPQEGRNHWSTRLVNLERLGGKVEVWPPLLRWQREARVFASPLTHRRASSPWFEGAAPTWVSAVVVATSSLALWHVAATHPQDTVVRRTSAGESQRCDCSSHTRRQRGSCLGNVLHEQVRQPAPTERAGRVRYARLVE